MDKKERPLKAYVVAGQFAYSVFVPLILCIVIGQYVSGKFNLGEGGVLVFTIIGIIVMVLSLISFVYKLMKMYDTDDKEKYKWIKSDYDD